MKVGMGVMTFGNVLGNDDGGDVGVINALIWAFDNCGVVGIDDLGMTRCGCFCFCCCFEGANGSPLTLKGVPTTSISVSTSLVTSGMYMVGNFILSDFLLLPAAKCSFQINQTTERNQRRGR